MRYAYIVVSTFFFIVSILLLKFHIFLFVAIIFFFVSFSMVTMAVFKILSPDPNIGATLGVNLCLLPFLLKKKKKGSHFPVSLFLE